MCGIAGFIELRKRPSNQELAEIATSMADKIIHRGPDDGGVWTDEENGIAFAHRRLSIIDLSVEGRQPMVSSCGRFVIVYNGEIYNYQDIANDLAADGAVFKGHSDTEVLLEAVSRWGLVKALEAANGMFAFALWDKKEKQLHLCRDRFGQKPLFYGWSNGVFLFSSELKAFDAHKSFAQAVDSGSLTLYLRHGFVPAPYSVFENIFKLTAGTYLTLSQEALSKPENFSPEPDGNASTFPKRYWSALEAVAKGNNSPFEGSDKEAVDALEELLSDAVGKCMVSDVPLGAFLSGGIDSSAIVALMQKQSSRPVKTFSMGFHEKQFNEAHHAAAVAKHLGTDHTEMYVTQKDAREVIPQLPAMYDEPFSDSSQIPTYLVSKMARQHVTVSLSGDGGDEFFGGYNRYLLGRKITRASSMTPSFVKKAATKFMQGVPVGKWDYLADKVSGILPQSMQYSQVGDKIHKLAGIIDSNSREETYHKLVSIWQNPKKAVINGFEPSTLLGDYSRWLSPNDKLTTEQNFISSMMYLDSMVYMSDDILTKVDRASMAVSLESRVPLLDHRIFEFAWSLPLSMKIRNGEGKWILKQALYRHVPKKLIDRPKTGFGVPIADWLRGDLKDWANTLLTSQKLKEQGYFNPEIINKMWAEHLSGTRNWHHQLWAVLMFQSWLENKRES